MLPVRESAVSRVVTSRESNNSVPGKPIIEFSLSWPAVHLKKL